MDAVRTVARTYPHWSYTVQPREEGIFYWQSNLRKTCAWDKPLFDKTIKYFDSKLKVTGKVRSLTLNVTKTYGGRRGTAPLIRNLGFKFNYQFSFQRKTANLKRDVTHGFTECTCTTCRAEYSRWLYLTIMQGMTRAFFYTRLKLPCV
jgi:hypothetical protein